MTQIAEFFTLLVARLIAGVMTGLVACSFWFLLTLLIPSSGLVVAIAWASFVIGFIYGAFVSE